MRTIRNILRYLTSLILMFVLVLLQLGLFARTILLSPDYYAKRLTTTDYYQALREEIDKGLADLSLITSIPAEILTDTVSNEAVNALSSNNILEATHFMKYKTDEVENTLDGSDIEASLNDFIDDYAAQNGFEVDDDQRAQIHEVAEQVVSIVTNHTVLFNINAVKRFGEFQRFRRIIYLFYSYWYFFALAAALCIAALFALNPIRLRRGYLWAGSSMIASSLMTIIPAMLALLYRIPYRFNIATSYLKTALQAFTLGYIRFFLFAGFTLLITGLLSLVLYVHLSKQVMLQRRVRFKHLNDDQFLTPESSCTVTGGQNLR
jgi:hypothetical protein